MWKIVALYGFDEIANAEKLRKYLLALPEVETMCGTLLVAPEGVNGTLACESQEILESFVAKLREKASVRDGDIKYSYAYEKPFQRLKIRLKREIITMRQPGSNPKLQVGTYVQPEEWNELIARKDMQLLDTRNTYETDYGIFEGAIDPQTSHFTDLVDYVRAGNLDKEKPVAMYCTGGIRCEKASAFFLSEGFKEVYHLEGGILRYLETVPQEQSKWQGGCFVFDDRVAVGHNLTPCELSEEDKHYRPRKPRKESQYQ